ncbi:hypothetical protein QZH41_014500, partial [Actinostola sp. cb2023]
SGGIAGTAVDVILFPLDTIKTRMQSSAGFFKAGGFRNIYSGIGSAATGSAPAAATFFATYEWTKNILTPNLPSSLLPGIYMVSAIVGEVASLVVRVPFEVVKQRAQAYSNMSSMQALKFTLAQEGFQGLYRGFLSTLVREVPFVFIEIPLWEMLKNDWSNYQGYNVNASQSGICGAVAGGFAAAVTTPLDVVKTRIMLAPKDSIETRLSIYRMLLRVRKEQGIRGLFAGVTIRVTWIAVGGAVFFGFYDKAKHVLMKSKDKNLDI